MISEMCDLPEVIKNIPYNLTSCLVDENNCEDLKLALMRKTEFPIKDALETGCSMFGWTVRIVPIFNVDNNTKLPTPLPFIPVVKEKDKTIDVIANMQMLRIKKAINGDMMYTADGKAIIDFLTLAYVFAFAVVAPNKIRMNDSIFRNLVDMYVSMIYGSVFRGTTLAVDENNLRMITFYVTRFITEGMFKEELDKYCDIRNMKKGFLDFEKELIGIIGIFLAKKKYIMAIAQKDGVDIMNDGYLKSMGIELARSSLSNH